MLPEFFRRPRHAGCRFVDEASGLPVELVHVEEGEDGRRLLVEFPCGHRRLVDESAVAPAGVAAGTTLLILMALSLAGLLAGAGLVVAAVP